MNRVEELIQQLCPNGVEWKKLGEVCDYERPTKYIVKSTNYNPQFQTPVLTAGQSFVLGYTDEAYGIYKANTQHPVIIFDDFTTSFQWVDFDFKVKSSAIKILIPSCESVLLRFVYYLMQTIHFEAVEHTRYWISRYSQIEIPVPPLSIQQEIVRILDTFTELTANLQTELDARKKQYVYYRDCLLNFEGVDGVEWKKLGEVLRSIRTGLNPRTFFKLNTPDAGSYYVTIREFSNGKLKFTSITDKINEKARVLCNNRSNLELDDVLFSGTGTIGETYVINQEPLNWNIKEGVYALKPIKTIILPQYLQYILSQSNIKSKYLKLADGGTVKSISMKKLNDFSIPIPPLPEQRRIVAILDHFETLVNDLSVGLPAELEARRKQYEYYRDKLLTFDRV